MNVGLALVFIALLLLKVTGLVAWSWWIITAPLWAGLAFFVVVCVFIAVAAVVAALAS